MAPIPVVAVATYYTSTTGVDSFAPSTSPPIIRKDIVFGGDKKLARSSTRWRCCSALQKAITVQSECPVGLIGDDIEAVSKQASKKINKPVIPVRCEGFRGVSQSLGHHIANDVIRDWVPPNWVMRRNSKAPVRCGHHR